MSLHLVVLAFSTFPQVDQYVRLCYDFSLHTFKLAQSLYIYRRKTHCPSIQIFRKYQFMVTLINTLQFTSLNLELNSNSMILFIDKIHLVL